MERRAPTVRRWRMFDMMTDMVRGMAAVSAMKPTFCAFLLDEMTKNGPGKRLDSWYTADGVRATMEYEGQNYIVEVKPIREEMRL